MAKVQGAILALTVSYALFQSLKPVEPQIVTTPETGFNTEVVATWYYAPGIDRTDLNLMLQLGEGLSPEGTFQRPIPVNEFFEGMPPDATGIFEAPFVWEPNNSVLYHIENGYIVGSDFRLGGAHEG